AAVVEERDLTAAERGIREINPGIYCTSAAFLEAALARLTNDNAQREYYLTDLVGIAVADGLRVTAVAVDDPDEVAGINSRAELAAVESQVRRALVARWMDAGVTFHDPATTYVGDCEIGDATNVGAGTITCNYDGFAKHRTIIGSRVQIGSDTQLVAPVTVGDDAYIGAGTTVTRDVPPGHLVVSRVPQREVPGWVKRRRARATG